MFYLCIFCYFLYLFLLFFLFLSLNLKTNLHSEISPIVAIKVLLCGVARFYNARLFAHSGTGRGILDEAEGRARHEHTFLASPSININCIIAAIWICQTSFVPCIRSREKKKHLFFVSTQPITCTTFHHPNYVLFFLLLLQVRDQIDEAAKGLVHILICNKKSELW